MHARIAHQDGQEKEAVQDCDEGIVVLAELLNVGRRALLQGVARQSAHVSIAVSVVQQNHVFRVAGEGKIRRDRVQDVDRVRSSHAPCAYLVHVLAPSLTKIGYDGEHGVLAVESHDKGRELAQLIEPKRLGKPLDSVDVSRQAVLLDCALVECILEDERRHRGQRHECEHGEGEEGCRSQRRHVFQGAERPDDRDRHQRLELPGRQCKARQLAEDGRRRSHEDKVGDEGSVARQARGRSSDLHAHVPEGGPSDGLVVLLAVQRVER
mmetsp:Transcript_29780/g.67457  ORF Transcript_29780/g.67457 Transcript_29780/m.67457 type:complete len:267 (-) Transcript_29780:410-1210(-)